jgi:ABC-type xylose transport system permease subunit
MEGAVIGSMLMGSAVNGSILMEMCCKWLNINGEVL